MTRTGFQNIQPGTEVTISSFGIHKGVVVEKNPTITMQGRTIQPTGWLKVRLHDETLPTEFREWNGDCKFVTLTGCTRANRIAA